MFGVIALDCGGIVDSIGGVITMANMSLPGVPGKLFDCIWLVKPYVEHQHKAHLLVRMEQLTNLGNPPKGKPDNKKKKKKKKRHNTTDPKTTFCLIVIYFKFDSVRNGRHESSARRRIRSEWSGSISNVPIPPTAPLDFNFIFDFVCRAFDLSAVCLSSILIPNEHIMMLQQSGTERWKCVRAWHRNPRWLRH